MKRRITFLCALILMNCVPLASAQESDFDTFLTRFDYEARADMKIDSKKLISLLAEKKAVLVDIRFKEEVLAWRMGFGLHIPLNELPKRLAELTKDKIIVTACQQVPAESNYSEWFEAIDAPALLLQGNPRQVVSANRKALELFGKELHEVEGHRGGQVFDCLHAFTEDGCEKDSNCEGCKIRDAIIDTFTTAKPHNGVSTSLPIKKANGTMIYALQVSTEKVGDLALVRIERFGKA